MYTHSKDYLKAHGEHLTAWLKLLIKNIVLTNGNLKEEDINESYDLLINSKEKEIIFDDANVINNAEKSFIFEKLTHVCGVNALKVNQEINFNKDITILYGTNGSGKSGYFRIINEISGGNEEKRILQNIYSEIEVPIEVKVKINTQQNDFVWKNEERGVIPFNKVRVFDSSYLRGLLEQRSPEESLIEPFGLHLFSCLIKCIESIKERINNDVLSRKSKKPTIDFENFSEQIKNFFVTNSNYDELKPKIEILYDFSDDKEVQLKKLQTEIESLNSTNYITEIKLLEQKEIKVKELCTSIKSKVENTKMLIETSKKTISDYKDFKTQSDDFKQKIDVLKTLPKIDSDEWKKFISSAQNYKNLLSDYDRCIYCNQPLIDSSKDIINAYVLFLHNDAVQKFDDIENKLNSLLSQIKTDITFSIDSIVSEDLKNAKITESINLICAEINDVNTSIKEALNNKDELAVSFTENYKKCVELLELQIQKYREEIIKLYACKDKKDEQVSDKKSQLNPLLENKKIALQKENIKLWFEIEDTIRNLEKIKNTINTTSISALSKRAHNELLTEQLKVIFSEELKSLGHKNLKVYLEEAGTSKGVASTKLIVNKNSKITDILSEGEQKAVGIAMFLAEINLQATRYPIVLDDPVNSLDHNVMKALVERLLQLDNQIIIFTHNILFLSFFESSGLGHICKNMNNGCSKTKGKHIYLYDVKEESDTSKGLIISKEENTAINHIGIAQSYLDERKNGYERSAADEIRIALEMLIDEKILLNITPQKYSSKNHRINWDNLKELGKSSILLSEIEKNYDRVSGGISHEGLESRENPLQEKELREMIDELEKMMNVKS